MSPVMISTIKPLEEFSLDKNVSQVYISDYIYIMHFIENEMWLA